MARKFRDYNLDQPYLLPPDLKEWLPEDHLALFISEIVQNLDLSSFYQVYESGQGRGQPPYHPAMMLGLLLYGYCTGVFSSRKIERATYEIVPFRFLSANQHPDHDSIATFRRRHIEQIKEVFIQVVLICREMGLVQLGHVAIDGTKIKANASKRNTVETGDIPLLIERQKAKIVEMLEKAEHADEEETLDRHRVSKSIAKARKRLEKLESAQAAVDAKLKEHEQLLREREAVIEESNTQNSVQRRRAGKQLCQLRLARGLTQLELGLLTNLSRSRISDFETGRLRPNAKEFSRLEEALKTKLPHFPERIPKRRNSGNKPPLPLRQNLTDPDSRLIKPSLYSSSVQAYNPQVAVDSAFQVIVATELSNSPNDANNLLPVVDAVKRNLGQLPRVISADTGYCSVANLQDARLGSVNTLIPPRRPRSNHSYTNPTLKAMREKLEQDDQKRLYNQRSQIVEPPFGRIKWLLKFSQFHLRGAKKVSGEWSLVATAHNLLKAFTYGR